MDKLKEETVELIEAYENIVSDYGSRMGRIRRMRESGEPIDMDLQTIEMFERSLKNIEPSLGKKILELDLVLHEN